MLASVLSPEPKELQQKQEQVLATPTPEVQSKRPETVRSKRDFREHLMSAVNKLQSRMQLHADKQGRTTMRLIKQLRTEYDRQLQVRSMGQAEARRANVKFRVETVLHT